MRPLRRDTCPTVRAPMPSGDGLLARITPRRALLGADAASALDALARTLGNGVIELTSRGNLQLRGLDAAGAPRLADALAPFGLDRRRVLGASPFLDDRGASLHDALERDGLDGSGEVEDGLPPKFTVRVEGGPVRTAPVPADITLRATVDGASIGACGREATVATADAPAAVRRLLAAFRRTGARRMRDLAPDAVAALFAAAGIASRPRQASSPRAAADPLGLLDAVPGALGVAAPFGAFGPGELAPLARLAASRGDGTLRIAPDRIVMLAGSRDPASTRDAAAALGLVTTPADPRRRIRACAGAPACDRGFRPARAVAAAFLSLVPADGLLHLSGCPKGCAHPGRAALTLAGLPDGYAIGRDVRAADLAGPAVAGPAIAGLATAGPEPA